MKRTYEISDEFIQEAYTQACADWKKKIKATFPEAFCVIKEPKPFTWYMDSRKDLTRILLTDKTGEIERARGLGVDGSYYTVGFENENLVNAPIRDVIEAVQGYWSGIFEGDYPKLSAEIGDAPMGMGYFKVEKEKIIYIRRNGEETLLFSYAKGFVEPKKRVTIKDLYENYDIVVVDSGDKVI